jgi:endonuclease-3
MAQALEERYGGEVPTALEDFVTLPGVGRKTGNVVRSVWFHLPGLAVDTHVTRLSHRLRLTNETDPVKIELDLDGIVPPEERGDLSLRLIEHGRKVCDAKRPRCDVCLLADICPSAFTFTSTKRKATAGARPAARAVRRSATVDDAG